MEIKAFREPEFQRVANHSFEQLKKQCTLHGLAPPPNLHQSQRLKKTYQYLQVNYLKNSLYKVSPELHSKVPLLKQQENLKEYLIEVQNDAEKHHDIRNQLKANFFFKTHPKTPSRSSKSKQIHYSFNNNKHKHQSVIQLFDPIQYLQEQESQKKKKLAKNLKNLQGLHSFSSNIDSVKYISEAPDIKIPGPLPALGTKSLLTLNSKIDKKMPKTHEEISKSISQIMEKSIEYQSQSKNGPKKIKHYKSRNDLKKANDKKIHTQRKKIMSMIEEKSSATLQNNLFSPKNLNQISAKQKYAIDFTLYMRTKTKSQLDKYMYEKLIRKPEKDLEKFQEFMLKEVKFENEQNKHKMERFFINMQSEFRRIEKYSQQGSKFDWRSKSVHLDEMKKEAEQFGASDGIQGKLNGTEKMKKSLPKKFKSARERFMKVESVERGRGKLDGIKGCQVNEISQSIGLVEEEQMREDQRVQI